MHPEADEHNVSKVGYFQENPYFTYVCRGKYSFSLSTYHNLYI